MKIKLFHTIELAHNHLIRLNEVYEGTHRPSSTLPTLHIVHFKHVGLQNYLRRDAKLGGVSNGDQIIVLVNHEDVRKSMIFQKT